MAVTHFNLGEFKIAAFSVSALTATGERSAVLMDEIAFTHILSLSLPLIPSFLPSRSFSLFLSYCLLLPHSLHLFSSALDSFFFSIHREVIKYAVHLSVS